MQIVGMNCGECDEAISFASQGAYCTSCKKAYHKKCLALTKLCPSCRKGNYLKSGAELIHEDTEEEKAEKEKANRTNSLIGGAVLTVIFLLVGTLAILYPDAMSGYDPHGRRILLKTVVKFGWGVPGGIISLVLGILVGWGTILTLREKGTSTAENEE